MLLHRVRSVAFAYIIQASGGRDELNDARRDQSIIDDNLSRGN